ncbi:hypothetical protein B0H13DRAFT_1915830 [Mycena leptocephala]|nr:hypothetical protein B0H13DRAFT_1915830 [Mycena leptocephala]
MCEGSSPMQVAETSAREGRSVEAYAATSVRPCALTCVSYPCTPPRVSSAPNLPAVAPSFRRSQHKDHAQRYGNSPTRMAPFLVPPGALRMQVARNLGIRGVGSAGERVVCTEKDVSSACHAPTGREGGWSAEGKGCGMMEKGETGEGEKCGESKGLSPHLLREEDAISHTKSEHNVGWDREDSERKDQNKERTGEAGESREETDTHDWHVIHEQQFGVGEGMHEDGGVRGWRLGEGVLGEKEGRQIKVATRRQWWVAVTIYRLSWRKDSTQEQDYIPVAKYRRYFARERSTPPASSSRALVGLKTAFSTPDKGQA